MQIFQVVHNGESYLVEGGNIAELQARITEAVRAGGGYVTFDVAQDFESDGPVTIYVSAQNAPTLVLI